MQLPNGVLPICKLPFPNASNRNEVCRALWAQLFLWFQSKKNATILLHLDNYMLQSRNLSQLFGYHSYFLRNAFYTDLDNESCQKSNNAIPTLIFGPHRSCFL